MSRSLRQGPRALELCVVSRLLAALVGVGRRAVGAPRSWTVATLLLSGCAGTWGERAADIGLLTSSALIACDVDGTVWASHGGRWDRDSPRAGYTIAEMNPLLGHRPDPGTVLTGGVVAVAAGILAWSDTLPRWARIGWFATAIAVEGYAVASNVSRVGACGVRP